MDANSEVWRLDCEIRYIAGLSQDRRTEFYLGAKKHRGEAAATRLVEQVNAYRRASFAATGSASYSGGTAARTALAKDAIREC
jgi:hypothetical protein